MIIADQNTNSDRVSYALALLESSGYDDPWRDEIAYEIIHGSPDEVDQLIEDLLMNQVDRWQSYRLKDINRRLDKHEND